MKGDSIKDNDFKSYSLMRPSLRNDKCIEISKNFKYFGVYSDILKESGQSITIY